MSRRKCIRFEIKPIDYGLRAIEAYSGERKLLLAIDTGADHGIIKESVLKDCIYDGKGHNVTGFGMSAAMKYKLIDLQLDFVITKKFILKAYFQFAPFSSNPEYGINGLDVDGLIGMPFLQYCDIDLNENVLRFYPERLIDNSSSKEFVQE